MLLQRWAMVRPQFQNRQPPARKVLLMAQILVANDEQMETRGFSFAEEVAAFQFAPAHLHRRMNFHGRATLDAPASACRRQAALSSGEFGGDPLPTVTQNRLGLFTRDALERFEEIIQRQSLSQIIEQGLNRKPR